MTTRTGARVSLCLLLMIGCRYPSAEQAERDSLRLTREAVFVALDEVPLDSICRRLRCGVLLLDTDVRAAARVGLASFDTGAVRLVLEPAAAARALRHSGPVAQRVFPLSGVGDDTVAVAVFAVGPLAGSPDSMSVMIYVDALGSYGAILVFHLRRGVAGWRVTSRDFHEG